MSGGGIGKSFLFMNDDPKSNGSPRTNPAVADLERTLSSFRTADRYQPYSAGPSTPAARSGTSSRSRHIFIRPTGSGSSAIPRTMTKTIASANLFDPSAPDSSSSFVATRSNSKIYQRIRAIEHEYAKGYSPIHNNRSPTTHYPRSLASLNFIGGRRQHLSPTRFSTTPGGNPSPRGPAGMHADIELAHQFHQAGGAGSTSPSRARSLHLNKLYLHSSSLTAGSEYLGIIPTSSLTSEFASPRKRDWAKEGVGRAVGGVSARTRFGAAVHHDKSGIIYGQDARAGRHEKVDYAELARNLINEERRSVPRRDHAEESRVRSAGRLWREFARSAGVIMTNYTGRADHDYTQDVDVEPYGGSSRSDGNVLVMSDNEFDVPMCSFSSPARQPQSKNYYHYVPEDRAGRSGASAVRSLTSQPISSSSRYPYNTLTGDTSIMNNSTVSSHSQRQPVRRPTVERYRTPFARYLRSRSRTPMKNVQGAYGGGVGEDFFRAGGEDVDAYASAASATARIEAEMTPPVNNVSYHSSSARIIQDFLAQTRNKFRGDRAADPASTHARGRAAPHPLLQGQSQGTLQVQYQLQEPQQQEPAPVPPSFRERLSEMRRSHLEGLERILSPEKRRVLSTSGRIIYPTQNRYRTEGAGMERSSDAASVIGTSSPSRLQYSRSHAFDTALQTMSIPSKRTTSAARHLVSPSPTSPKKPDVSTYFLEAALRSYI